MHTERCVDQNDALAVAGAVVSHGGSGTTLGAIGAGLPSVIVPIVADQFANAASVEAGGAGVVVTGESDDGRRDEGGVEPLRPGAAASISGNGR